MWKKCINILLAVWLINSVTYFQLSGPLNAAPNTGKTFAHGIHHPPVNWVSFILHEFDDANHDESGKAKPIKVKRRYVNSRSANFSAFLTTPVLSLFDVQRKCIIKELKPSGYLALVPRPAYYNFLFRLSPF